MKIIFPLIIVCLFSFKPGSPNDFPSLKQVNSDSSILVSVRFNDIGGSSTVGCGVLVIKAHYKFKLAFDSKYAVKSKDGIIRIEFTCPKENGFGFFEKDKLYKFRVREIYQSKSGEKTNLPNDIPMYEYLGRY